MIKAQGQQLTRINWAIHVCRGAGLRRGCEPWEESPELTLQLFCWKPERDGWWFASGSPVKGQRSVGRRVQLLADSSVVWCSTSHQITDRGLPPPKPERSLMQYVCCRAALMYRERFLLGGKHFCLLACSESCFLFKMLDTVTEKEVALPCSVEYASLFGKPHCLAFILRSTKSIAVFF